MNECHFTWGQSEGGRIRLELGKISDFKNIFDRVLFTPPARRAWRSCKFAPFLFFFFIFQSRKLGYRSRVIPLAFLCCLAHCYIHLNPFYSRICQQNTHLNMYTEISKRKQGSPCKNSHQIYFEKTNFDRLHREELLFVPSYTHRLNSFSSTITQQNTHLNMYIETSKQEQGFPCKNSHQKCFKKDKF